MAHYLDADFDRSAIYAYDVIVRHNSPSLSNKRVFAVPLSGFPIGVKCDDRGHVYAGCSDGIEVWNAGGMLQAVIEIPGEYGMLRSHYGALYSYIVC